MRLPLTMAIVFALLSPWLVAADTSADASVLAYLFASHPWLAEAIKIVAAFVGFTVWLCSAIANYVSPTRKIGFVPIGLIVHTVANNGKEIRGALAREKALTDTAEKEATKSSNGTSIPMFLGFFLLSSAASAQTVENTSCAKTGFFSQVSCTTGIAPIFSAFDYAKQGKVWIVVPGVGLAAGYQARQEWRSFMLSELAFTGYQQGASGPNLQLAFGVTIGYQWAKTSCSIGVSDDALLLGQNRSSGFLTPFSSLGNVHLLLALGVPIG